MSEEERNLAIAREGLEAFRRGDMETFLNLLDPDVEVFSPPELPNPAHFTGRDGYLPWASRWLDAWESFELVGEAFEPVGEHHVLMSVVQRGVGKGAGWRWRCASATCSRTATGWRRGCTCMPIAGRR